MSGWIKLYRSVQDHWLYNEKRKFSRFEAWNDILLTVNFTDAQTIIKGKVYDVKRGQSILSLESWSKRWSWDKNAVRRFLTLLQKEEMIDLVSDNITTQLTVCKYEDYQGEGNANETQKKRKRNAKNIQTTPIKEGEEDKEEKERDSVQRFLAWFNSMILKYKKVEGKFKTLDTTDINNLLKLKELKFTPDDWEIAFQCMYNDKWIKENNMCKPSHFLRVDNFQKYLNQYEPTRIKAVWQ